MRLVVIAVLSLSLFSCKKTITDNGHGRMCTYTCGNATLTPRLNGNAEDLDTVVLKIYSINSNFTDDKLKDTKYYYNVETGDIRLKEGEEYEIITASDTLRITDIQFEPARQEYILCADHCTVAPTSVTVNGIVKEPSVEDRDVFGF